MRKKNLGDNYLDEENDKIEEEIDDVGGDDNDDGLENFDNSH